MSSCQNSSGRQHWKDQVYKNSKTLANAITLASSNESYCLQYVQFIRLLEKLLTLPHGPAEKALVQRFRKCVGVQSKNHVIEPVQYDERGMAFSTSEGNDIPQRDLSPLKTQKPIILVVLLSSAYWFCWVFANVTLGFLILRLYWSCFVWLGFDFLFF